NFRVGIELRFPDPTVQWRAAYSQYVYLSRRPAVTRPHDHRRRRKTRCAAGFRHELSDLENAVQCRPENCGHYDDSQRRVAHAGGGYAAPIRPLWRRSLDAHELETQRHTELGSF